MMFKTSLVMGGVLIGVLSVWIAQILIQPPQLVETILYYGCGLLTGAVGSAMLMFIFVQQVANCLMPQRVRAKKTEQMVNLPAVKEEEILPTFDDVPTAESVDPEDEWLNDPDFWKRR